MFIFFFLLAPSQDDCLENPPPAHMTSTPDLPVAPVTPSIPENTTTNAPIFFRLFEFSPEVPIRLDYHGKHMDMGQVRRRWRVLSCVCAEACVAICVSTCSCVRFCVRVRVRVRFCVYVRVRFCV